MSSKSKASTATAIAASSKTLSRGQQYRRRKSVQAMESFVQKVLLPPQRAEAVADSEGATVAPEANNKEDNDDASCILPPTVIKALALCHERFISVVGQQLVRQLQQEAKTSQQHAKSQQQPPQQQNASLIQRVKVDAVKNALTTLNMSHLLETVDTAVATCTAPKQDEDHVDDDVTGKATATTGKRRRKAAPPSATAAAAAAALPSSTTGNHTTTSTAATATTTAPASRKRKKNKWTPMDEAEQERLLALSKEKLLQR